MLETLHRNLTKSKGLVSGGVNLTAVYVKLKSGQRGGGEKLKIPEQTIFVLVYCISLAFKIRNFRSRNKSTILRRSL